MAKVMNIHGTSGDRVTEGLPEDRVNRGEGAKAWVVYDTMLRPWGPFDSAKAAADWARETWPGTDDWEVQPLWTPTS